MHAELQKGGKEGRKTLKDLQDSTKELSDMPAARKKSAEDEKKNIESVNIGD
jgi:hypothetical protein